MKTLLSSFNTLLLMVSSFSCIALSILLYIKWLSFDNKTKKNLPPSPPKLPIIGNLHQLGSHPERNLQKLSQKYGPLMLIHMGSMPTIIASSEQAAKEIMRTHDIIFSGRPCLTLANIILPNSVTFSPYGEQWRRLKSIMVTKLLSNTRVKSYKKARCDEVDKMIRVLDESCGTTVDIGSLFTLIANNIISEVALGGKFDGSKYASLVKKGVDCLGAFHFGSYIPWLSWVDQITCVVQKTRRIAKDLDEFIEQIVEDHVNKKQGDGVKGDEGEDFVDILLDLQKSNTLGKDSLKILILEVFGAGTDTTSLSMEWALSELIRNPRVMKKLQHEAKEVLEGKGRSRIFEEDLEKMPYLKAVVKESLRVHPIVPLLIPRKAKQDVKLMGYDIAADTQVMINALAIGRDPDLWEEPNEFRPERFLNNSINYTDMQFKWLPFGAGRRSCPGMQFSLPIIELVLANIVSKFDITLPNGVKNEDLDMSEVSSITVHKKSSLLVSMSPKF